MGKSSRLGSKNLHRVGCAELVTSNDQWPVETVLLGFVPQPNLRLSAAPCKAVRCAKLSRIFLPAGIAMETQKLTVRLPIDDIAFLKGYARNRGITVTEALHRYLYRMRELARADIHPEVSGITGLAPSDIDAREAYGEHLAEKHR
jgi:hypothetical protein